MSLKPKALIATAAVAIAAIAGYSYASPWMTLKNLRDDAMAGKADKMSDYVDFPMLLESLKGQIQGVMMNSLSSPEMKDNPFSGLAMAMAGGLIDSMVGTLASPNGVVNMVQGKDAREEVAVQTAPAPATSDAKSAKAFNGAVNYDGYSRVIVKAKDAQDGDPYIVMKREGLFSWKVVDIQLGAINEQ